MKTAHKTLYFKEREVWWTQVGQNVGFEINGKGPQSLRPVLVLRKFNKDFFFGVPLTTKDKANKYYTPTDFMKEVSSFAILSQLRAYDANRLVDKMGMISQSRFTKVQNQLIGLLQQSQK